MKFLRISQHNSLLLCIIPGALLNTVVANQVHTNIQVDFLDEDAVLNETALMQYSTVFVTEPNVPSAVIAQLAKYATGGGTLVLSAGAAQFDEYNTSESTFSNLTGSTTTTLRRRVLPEVRQVRVILWSLSVAG